MDKTKRVFVNIGVLVILFITINSIFSRTFNKYFKESSIDNFIYSLQISFFYPRVLSSSYKQAIEQRMKTVMKKNTIFRKLNTLGSLSYDLSHLSNVDAKKDEMLLNKMVNDLIILYEYIPSKDECDSIGLDSLSCRVVGIIAGHSNSKEAHKFILQVLKYGPENVRDSALKYSSVLGVHGDDIWDAVIDLEKKGLKRKAEIFYPLKSINIERSNQYLVGIAKTTENIDEFYHAGHLLSFDKDPALLDEVLPRMLTFPWPAKSFGPVRPLTAVSSNYIRLYVKTAEGKKLSVGLEVMRKTGGWGRDDYSVIEEKLYSSKSDSRLQAVEYIKEFPKHNHRIKAEDIIKVLGQCFENENNEKVKKGIVKAISHLKKVKG